MFNSRDSKDYLLEKEDYKVPLEFRIGILILVAICLSVFSGLVLGHWLTLKALETSCDKIQTISLINRQYSCKPIRVDQALQLKGRKIKHVKRNVCT